MERELVLQGGSRGGRGWKTAVNSHLTGPASDILMAVAEATFLFLSLYAILKTPSQVDLCLIKHARISFLSCQTGQLSELETNEDV